MRNYWDILKKYDTNGNKKKNTTVSVIESPMMKMAYTGDGDKYDPAGIVQTTNGPVAIHKGEGMIEGPNGMTTVVPQDELRKTIEENNIPGMAIGGSFKPISRITSALPNISLPKAQTVSTPQYNYSSVAQPSAISPVIMEGAFNTTGPKSITTQAPTITLPFSKPVTVTDRTQSAKAIGDQIAGQSYANSLMAQNAGQGYADQVAGQAYADSLVAQNQGQTYADSLMAQNPATPAATIPTPLPTIQQTGQAAADQSKWQAYADDLVAKNAADGVAAQQAGQAYADSLVAQNAPAVGAATISTPTSTTGQSGYNYLGDQNRVRSYYASTMAGTNPYDRALLDRYLQQYDASSATGLTAALQAAASDPNMSEAARRGIYFDMMRGTSVGRGELMGGLAAQQAQRADQAAGELFNVATGMRTYEDQRAREAFDTAMGAGDYKGAAAQYKAMYGMDIDPSYLEANKATILAQAGLTTEGMRLSNAQQSIVLEKMGLEVADIKDTQSWDKFLRAAEFGSDADMRYYYQLATGRELGDDSMVANSRAYVKGTRATELETGRLNLEGLRTQLGVDKFNSAVTMAGSGADVTTINNTLGLNLDDAQFNRIYGITPAGRQDKMDKLTAFNTLMQTDDPANYDTASATFKDIFGIDIDFSSEKSDTVLGKLDNAISNVNDMIAEAYNLGLDQTSDGKAYIESLMNTKGALYGQQARTSGVDLGDMSFTGTTTSGTPTNNIMDADNTTVIQDLAANPRTNAILTYLVGANDPQGYSAGPIFDYFFGETEGQGIVTNILSGMTPEAKAMWNTLRTSSNDAEVAKAAEYFLPVLGAIWNEQVNNKPIPDIEIMAGGAKVNLRDFASFLGYQPALGVDGLPISGTGGETTTPTTDWSTTVPSNVLSKLSGLPESGMIADVSGGPPVFKLTRSEMLNIAQNNDYVSTLRMPVSGTSMYEFGKMNSGRLFVAPNNNHVWTIKTYKDEGETPGYVTFWDVTDNKYYTADSVPEVRSFYDSITSGTNTNG